MIIEGASGADARTREGTRSEDKSLIVAEALDGRNRRTRQRESYLVGSVGINGGAATKILACTGRIPREEGGAGDLVEALWLLTLLSTLFVVDEVELKNTAMVPIWVLLLLLVLALAGFLTPPRGHYIILCF